MKTTYTPYALGGNLVALGGNLWNEMVSRAFRSRDNTTGDLQVVAHAFFEEIIPEMQNFMEQKLAANPQLAHIFHLHAMTKMNHGTCQPRIERACTACNAKDDLAALLDRGADTVRCKKVLGGGPLPRVACGAPRPCPIHDAGKPQCGTNHESPAVVGFLPIQNCPVCADTPKDVLPKTTAGEACGTWNENVSCTIREHVGLRRLIQKMGMGQPLMPDPALGQDVAFLAHVITEAHKKLQAANLQVDGARKILSGGYHQGGNGLVINRNQVEAWLRGPIAEKQKSELDMVAYERDLKAAKGLLETPPNDTCENYRNGSGELVGRFCSAIKGHAPTCQFFKKPEGGP